MDYIGLAWSLVSINGVRCRHKPVVSEQVLVVPWHGLLCENVSKAVGLPHLCHTRTKLSHLAPKGIKSHLSSIYWKGGRRFLVYFSVLTWVWWDNLDFWKNGQRHQRSRTGREGLAALSVDETATWPSCLIIMWQTWVQGQDGCDRGVRGPLFNDESHVWVFLTVLAPNCNDDSNNSNKTNDQ